MRIISGRLKGTSLLAPKDLPVRPTTDKAKEGLFNILANRMEISGSTCLDLFAGTGNISFELASRDCAHVLAVDKHPKCVRFIQDTARKFKMEKVEAVQADVFRFLELEKMNFDLIFADPPYDLSNQFRLPELIFSRNFLNPGGIFILEHASLLQMDKAINHKEVRIYGSSAFSFFYL